MTALGFEPAPSDTSATTVKAFDTLRELVRAKNQLWFYRFRPLNARVRRRPPRQPVRRR